MTVSKTKVKTKENWIGYNKVKCPICEKFGKILYYRQGRKNNRMFLEYYYCDQCFVIFDEFERVLRALKKVGSK